MHLSALSVGRRGPEAPWVRLQTAQASPLPVGCLLSNWNHNGAEQLVFKVLWQASGGCQSGLLCLSCLLDAEMLSCLLGMLSYFDTLLSRLPKCAP